MRPAILLLAAVAVVHAVVLPRYQRIRDQEEIHVDLMPNSDVRYYYRVSDASEPLFMYVTPCGGEVHWQIYSITGDVARAARAHPLSSSRQLFLMAGEAGTRRMRFIAPYANTERLLIVLSASSAASARLFVATSQADIDEQYPALPDDTRLGHAVATTRHDGGSALISWKLAPKIQHADGEKYRICAIVSRREDEWAVCDHLDEGLESIHCVSNNKNQMRIDKLRSGKHYWITLFVRDSSTGATSSYTPLEVDVPAAEVELISKRRSEKKAQQNEQLHDAVMQQGLVPAGKGASVNYDLVLPKNVSASKRVLLVVHACDGFVRVNVYRNGRLLKKSEAFSGFRRFLVLNVQDGSLRFQISNEDRREKAVRLWASTRPSLSPYPLLPDDTTVRVSRRTCQSTSLQWLRAPDDHVEYCLYKRQEKANFLEQLVSRVDNLCAGGLSSDLVGCYSHRGPQSSGELDGLIETRVDNLQPATTYRFDLLARPLHRPSSQFLPYRTVWVRTSKSC